MKRYLLIILVLFLALFYGCSNSATPETPCSGILCSGHGNCIILGKDQPNCQCDEGYYVDQFSCLPGTSPCLGETCSNQGTCEISDGEAICHCKDGFTPLGLSCIDPCVDHETCGGHGRCDTVGQEGFCYCDSGFYADGLTCIAGDSPCNGITCSNHGKCVVQNSVPVCNCDTGYVANGQTCVDPCIGNETCGGHGVCGVKEGKVACTCDDGYLPSGTTCLEKEDICKTLICEGGTCDPNTGACVCSGDDILDGNRCRAKIGCEKPEANCGTYGTCKEDIEGDWWCECQSGYRFDGSSCVSLFCPDGVICGGQCCGVNQACIGNNQCGDIAQNSNDGCSKDSDCATGSFCDTVINTCIKIVDSGSAGCFFQPEFQQQMDLETLWSWDKENILMTPVVANMTDDNNDGKIDLEDTPDVIFSSYPNYDQRYGEIYILSGSDGSEKLHITSHQIDRTSSLAVGDIDNDGYNEIIAIEDNNETTLAFNHDGTLLWEQNTKLSYGDNSKVSGAPMIVDVDQDGQPEVIVGATILNGKTGKERCSYASSFGNNSDGYFNSYISVAADINGDHVTDIIAGNAVISGADCSLIYQPSESDRTDGFTAVADLNLDGNPDIVTVSEGQLYIYDNLFADLVTPFVIDEPFCNTGGSIDSCSQNSIRLPLGGAPTIANFDDDPYLEIAVAGAFYYGVIKPDFTSKTASYLWKNETQDQSSRQTGSSLFDFEGDGKAEVLYADECYLRIYESDSGKERFKLKNSSATSLEYPLVVDVDGDLKSEIVVVANKDDEDNSSAQYECDWGTHRYDGNRGIRVLQDPYDNWVKTRRIWNQHSYHITNVNEDGSIPQVEEESWKSYNSYRLNAPGSGLFNVPDFKIEWVDVKRQDCPQLSYTLTISVLNIGAISVPAGIPLAIYQGTTDQNELIGTMKTDTVLWPGKRHVLTYQFTPQNSDVRTYNLYLQIDDEGNGKGNYTECNETNNSYTTTFKGRYAVYCKSGVGLCTRFGPYSCNSAGTLVCGAVPGSPVEEVCNNGLDDDCNGQTDENCGCEGTQSCYSGYAQSFNTDNSKSVCKRGEQICYGGEIWSECQEEVLPAAEICDGLDNDCDGSVDEGFDLGQSCVSGLGICERSGTYVCDNSGNQICDATPGTSQLEQCNDNKDNDCDGLTDERPCQE